MVLSGVLCCSMLANTEWNQWNHYWIAVWPLNQLFQVWIFELFFIAFIIYLFSFIFIIILVCSNVAYNSLLVGFVFCKINPNRNTNWQHSAVDIEYQRLERNPIHTNLYLKNIHPYNHRTTTPFALLYLAVPMGLGYCLLWFSLLIQLFVAISVKSKFFSIQISGKTVGWTWASLGFLREIIWDII